MDEKCAVGKKLNRFGEGQQNHNFIKENLRNNSAKIAI
jgi:hypothetical protein